MSCLFWSRRSKSLHHRDGLEDWCGLRGERPVTTGHRGEAMRSDEIMGCETVDKLDGVN